MKYMKGYEYNQNIGNYAGKVYDIEFIPISLSLIDNQVYDVCADGHTYRHYRLLDKCTICLDIYTLRWTVYIELIDSICCIYRDIYFGMVCTGIITGTRYWFILMGAYVLLALVTLSQKSRHWWPGVKQNMCLNIYRFRWYQPKEIVGTNFKQLIPTNYQNACHYSLNICV